MQEEIKDIEVKDAEVLEVLEDTDENVISEEELKSRYDDVLAKAQATGFKNQPYKKIYNEEGELANPITKSNPYTNMFPNRSQRRKLIKQLSK